MIFVPYSSDAPIYHFPKCTISLIVINIITFIVLLSDSVSIDFVLSLTVNHGTIAPWQWVTSNFVHGGLGHLIGNMIILWVFGLVIEGKVGWKKFLAIYMGIGISQSALEQILFFFGEEGYSFGASSIIFGLIGIGMIWAPQNDVRWFYWIFFKFGTIPITLRTTAIIYGVLEILSVAVEFSVGALGTAFFHLMGAAIGVPIGIIMVKRNLVDCEGWDIFSLRYGRPKSINIIPQYEAEEEEEVDPEEQEAEFDQQRQDAEQFIRESLSERDSQAAISIYNDTKFETGSFELPDDLFMDLIYALKEDQNWKELKPLIFLGLETLPEKSIPLTLLLAEIYITADQRPTKGLETLEGLIFDFLSDGDKRTYQQLKLKAENLQSSGALELDIDD